MRAAPAASSPPRTGRRSPACSPQLTHRPPAVALGPALTRGRADRGPAPGAGCCGCPQLPEFWGTGSPFPAPSSRSSRHDRRADTHSRAPPRLPAAGGWHGLWPPASFVALLLPFAFRCRRAVGFQAPSRTRPKAQGGNWAGRQAGSRLGWGQPRWLRVPRTVRSSEAAKRRGCGSCGHALAARWAWGVVGAAGDTEVRGALRIHRGAETSQRLNLPRKLAK